MTRTLLCRISWHQWTQAQNPDGEFYARCSHCGVERVVDPAMSRRNRTRKGWQQLRDRYQRRSQ
jgi:hypothetical protein